MLPRCRQLRSVWTPHTSRERRPRPPLVVSGHEVSDDAGYRSSRGASVTAFRDWPAVRAQQDPEMSGREVPHHERAGPGLSDAEAFDYGWIAPEKQLSCEPPSSLGPRPTHHSRSRSAHMPPHASFVGAELSITLALHARGRRGFPRLIHERIPRLSYRSIRGSPKCGKRLVSGNQVSADIRSPSSVRTASERARAISVCADGM